MRLEIQLTSPIKESTDVLFRAILFNDDYDPLPVSRNAFIGPNVRALSPAGFPLPDSVEATFGGPDEALTLQPFTFYGRERTFSNLAAGEIEVTAVYRGAEGRPSLEVSQRFRVEPR